MVEINDLVAATRFPAGFKFALMILYFPIGVFLIVCRVLIALHTYIIVCLFPRGAARRQFVRGMLGVLGVHIWVEEDQSPSTESPKVLVANYTSVLDHIVIDVVINHFVPYHGNVPTVFQWVLGYKDLTSPQSKQQFLENMKKFVQEQDFPILIQPEGVPTNNTVGLLKFNTQAFELELPIQPVNKNVRFLSRDTLLYRVVVRQPLLQKHLPLSKSTFHVSVQMSRLSFPCALTTIDGPRWTDVLWCFFTPVTVFKLKTHPVMKREEAESVEDFSERVRTVIAGTLNLEKTEYTAADVREYRKKLKAEPPSQQRAKQTAQVSQNVTSGNNSGSCLDSVDAELRKMVQQVKDVLPQVPITAVKQDLEQTKDVDTTISNILEGRVAYSVGEGENTASQSQSASSLPDTDTTLFKASSFSRNPSDRHLSLEDRKKLMLETARLRYKQKHGML